MALTKCVIADISGKKRSPKSAAARMLRLAVQCAQDFRLSGWLPFFPNNIFLLSALLFIHFVFLCMSRSRRLLSNFGTNDNLPCAADFNQSFVYLSIFTTSFDDSAFSLVFSRNALPPFYTLLEFTSFHAWIPTNLGSLLPTPSVSYYKFPSQVCPTL